MPLRPEDIQGCALVPTGTALVYLGDPEAIPAGYVRANGKTQKKAEVPDLATTMNASPRRKTFVVPDLDAEMPMRSGVWIVKT